MLGLPEVSGNQVWKSLKIKSFAYFCSKMHIMSEGKQISPVGNIIPLPPGDLVQ